VLVPPLAKMVLDAVLIHDPAANHLDQFVTQIGSVQARSHQDQDLVARDAGLLERLQNRGQNQSRWGPDA
jgi:hypothetical protein